MIIAHESNNPGTFWISETVFDPELAYAGDFRNVEGPFYINFIMAHRSEWVESRCYPGCFRFSPDCIPFKPEPKKVYPEREIRHLTFSLRDIIRKAL